MTPALLIVILIVLLLVAFVVVLVRSMGRMERESAAYLQHMAPRLGLTVERAYPARLTGERQGRRVIVSMHQNSSKVSQVVSTSIEIPVTTSMTLQVEPQTSDLGARIAGDLELGHADFDASCLLRTSDPETTRRVLDDQVRTLLAEECGSGQLRLLVVRKQWLRIEIKGAPDDPAQEPRLVRYLDVALTLAGRLDAA